MADNIFLYKHPHRIMKKEKICRHCQREKEQNKNKFDQVVNQMLEDPDNQNVFMRSEYNTLA